jgi:hypothetical protein
MPTQRGVSGLALWGGSDSSYSLADVSAQGTGGCCTWFRFLHTLLPYLCSARWSAKMCLIAQVLAYRKMEEGSLLPPQEGHTEVGTGHSVHMGFVGKSFWGTSSFWTWLSVKTANVREENREIWAFYSVVPVWCPWRCRGSRKVGLI